MATLEAKGNKPSYWDNIWSKYRWRVDSPDVLKEMADRANTKEYWDELWKSPKRRVEKYSMQRAWWHISQTGAKSVLDAGCGNGRLLFGVKQNHPEIELFGIDISQVAIDRMKREYGVDGAVLDVYQVEELGRKFDCIVANHMLEHLYRDEDFLISCKNCLNENGTVFCAVPNNMSGPKETDEHVRKYNREMIEELFNKVFGNCEITIIGNHLIAVGKNAVS